MQTFAYKTSPKHVSDPNLLYAPATRATFSELAGFFDHASQKAFIVSVDLRIFKWRNVSSNPPTINEMHRFSDFLTDKTKTRLKVATLTDTANTETRWTTSHLFSYGSD
jgi:hypothetical protein